MPPSGQYNDYLTAMYLDGAADYLSDDFVAANSGLTRAITGGGRTHAALETRSRRAQRSSCRAAGELYVKKCFPERSRAKWRELGNLRKALGMHMKGTHMDERHYRKLVPGELDAFTVRVRVS